MGTNGEKIIENFTVLSKVEPEPGAGAGPGHLHLVNFPVLLLFSKDNWERCH